MHELELGEADGDAEIYDPPDYPPPKPIQNKPVQNNIRDGDAEVSRPMLTRQSEDGHVFSIGDDEFGNWADENDDDKYLMDLKCANL